MTVYVDDMFRYPIGQFRKMKMSHMIADTEDELHRMAAAIGVARRWYQGDHYDVAMSARARAVKLGAVEIAWEDCSLMMILRRGDPKAPLVTPEIGRAILDLV
jgi:hypothetical protein